MMEVYFEGKNGMIINFETIKTDEEEVDGAAVLETYDLIIEEGGKKEVAGSLEIKNYHWEEDGKYIEVDLWKEGTEEGYIEVPLGLNDIRIEINEGEGMKTVY